MKKSILPLFVTSLLCGGVFVLSACLSPVNFDPKKALQIETNVTGEVATTDVTAAVLMLTNRSKTVDVTSVTITQPEWLPTEENPNAQPPSISFANKPKRLEQKAQYLAPSDKSYQVVINYSYDKLGSTLAAGKDTQTLLIPLPLPRQIVEYVIYRNSKGDVIIDKEAKDPDPSDTGNPAIDPSPGEGSSPAVIPPEARNRMATFIVVSKTSSQIIDSVNFRMGDTDYTMGKIGVLDKQSIALGQGSWETRLTYTRETVEKTLGPINSIIVPSNDPQSIQEHYLYFYMNKRGNYAISQSWPPYPNDVEEEDMLPPDNGFGRGMIEIINNSTALAKTVTIHNLKAPTGYPYIIDYFKFVPAIPVQYNKTGYVDVIGTREFPIEAHEDYLIQVSLETSNSSAIVERKAYIKDQVVTIVITGNDLDSNTARGAKVTLENKTSTWPVEIIDMAVQNKANPGQSSYYGTSTWNPSGSIFKDKNAVQMVMSNEAMPITKGAEFVASVTMYGYGVLATITKSISPPVLYSEVPPNQNVRTITITDADVPQSIKDAAVSYQGAKVILENKVTSWSVEIIGLTVRNKNKTAESVYYSSSTWQPRVPIGKDQSAAQTVMSSTAMPITSNAQFEALIVINGYGKTETIAKTFNPDVLYSSLPPEQNSRTLTITDSDIPQSIKDAYIYSRGAKFSIFNETSASPVQIIGITIQNKTNHSQHSFYGESDWEPHTVIDKNQKAILMVSSSPAMPITASAEFEAVLRLFANNKSAEVTMTISPAVLYSTLDPDQNTRDIRVRDSDVPIELEPIAPPLPNSIGAKVTLENKITSWPVQIIGMTVQNKADRGKNSSYDRNTWLPGNQIDKNGSAVQMVYSSTAMPIASGDQFEAVITLKYNGTTATVTKDFSPDTKLYSTNPPDQNPRSITITDSDVPDSIKDAYILTRGAKVTIQNNVSAKWPVQITEMVVRNKANSSQHTDYSSASWEPKAVIGNSQSAVQMVMSSASMPIKSGVQFQAVITVLGNGQHATITKDFSPAVLYSNLDPVQNIRTIAISDTDLPLEVQTPPPYETGVPGLDGSTPIGKTVSIDGYPWYVADKTVIGGKTYVMLVCKKIMEYGVVYNDPRNSNYNGSNLQAIMTDLYKKMNQMKKIAVLPALGDHSKNYLTQPTPTMAGTTTKDVFFALTYQDAANLKDQAWNYGEIRWWTRSPAASDTVWEVQPAGKYIGGSVTNTLDLGAVPGVWVRAE
ncbi:MAG: hypothetical protein LBI14_08820 [Treponema sp.]|jgi:hypothetical protein|nr:hypothetical protein [Treponema sp.]